MISFQAAYTKCQRISGDTTANVLAQFKEDINIGYHRFNASLSRYFTRKQQLINLVASTQAYNLPVDLIKVTSVSAVVSTGFEVPLTQVRSEVEWRRFNILSESSNYITHYFILGNDQIALYPTPSASVTNGLRLIYQPQDVSLTKDDYTTGTVSITTSTTTVTGSGTSWTSASHDGMWLQVTDGSDGNWYEVDSVVSTTSITLAKAYSGPTVSGVAYKLGQMFIFPGEYDDAPVDYALVRYYEAKNNPSRATYHQRRYEDVVNKAVQAYASSSTSNVITDADDADSITNPWLLPPATG